MFGLAVVVVTLCAAAVGIARDRLRSYVGWVLAGHLCLFSVLIADALALNFNGPRTVLPASAFAVLGLATRASARQQPSSRQ